MSNELGLASPALPAYFLYPVALLSLLIIVFVMARVRDRAGAFVIGASWLRYVMSAFHTITYRPLPSVPAWHRNDAPGRDRGSRLIAIFRRLASVHRRSRNW